MNTPSREGLAQSLLLTALQCKNNTTSTIKVKLKNIPVVKVLDRNKQINAVSRLSGAPTFAVELEAAQRGVDAHRYRPHFIQRETQRLLVAHWDLLVAIALGRHA